MSNVLRLGDEREVNLYVARLGHFSATHPSAWFPVVVAGFKRQLGREVVHVRAVEASDDPMVENEWLVPFGALRKPEERGGG